MKALRPFDRDRGRRAVLDLMRGEWDAPIATLCEIFDVEAPRRLPPLFTTRAPTIPEVRPYVPKFLTGDYTPPPAEVAKVPPIVWRGPALRFEPVVDEALLRRFNREHTWCEVCGALGGVAGHHLIPRSVLRLDLEWNLLALCGRCHLNSSPTGFHYLGPRAWFRLNRLNLPSYARRNVMVVLFVIRPWISRGGREGRTIVTR